MPRPRPHLQTYLDAHPHDLARAVAEYRAAVASWRASHHGWRAAALCAGAIVVAWLLLHALTGCGAPDPAPGECAADCHAAWPEGSGGLLECVSACSSMGAAPVATEGSERAMTRDEHGRELPDGVYVDDTRYAAVPAPLPLAAMTGCDSHSVTPRASCAECNAIAVREDPTFTTGCPDHPRIWDRACATCEALLCGNAVEPAPLPCQGCGDTIPEGAPFSERVADGCPFCPGCAAENAAGDDPDEMRRGTWPDAAPAPTDDAGAELARLLPGLPAMLTHLRERFRFKMDEDRPGGAEVCWAVDACELLLGERERLVPILSSLLAPSDRGDTVAALTRTLANRDWLRVRESERTTAAEKIREQYGEIDRLRARIATLEAAPPPHTVAALLAELQRMREEGDGDMREAIEAVRAHLGAPSPLDRVVAEVLGLPVSGGAAIDHWNSICVEVDEANQEAGETRESFARIARVALAGMLACAAPPSDATKEPG